MGSPGKLGRFTFILVPPQRRRRACSSNSPHVTGSCEARSSSQGWRPNNCRHKEIFICFLPPAAKLDTLLVIPGRAARREPEIPGCCGAIAWIAGSRAAHAPRNDRLGRATWYNFSFLPTGPKESHDDREIACPRHGRTRHTDARLRRQGHRPCRMGPQGNRHRRDRDARPDGDARRIRPGAAAARRPHRRFAAHDDPDRGADRNPDGARRRRALGVLQHLLDPGPCRGGGGGRRHAGIRHQGRKPDRILGLHPPHFRMVGRRHPQHDSR